MRFRLFLVKHRTAVIFLLCLAICAGLYFALPYYRCYYSKASEGTRGVVGTLLGAIVGGSFTLLGSYIINNNDKKGTNAVKKKCLIYKPLYDELMVIHHEIINENPYPSIIRFEKGYQTMQRHPQYTVWGRIKKDDRYFEVPTKLKNSMNELYASIEEFQKKRVCAVNALDRIYREELKAIANREIPETANAGDSLLSYVLEGKRPDDGYLMWSFGDNDTKEADSLWRQLREKVDNDTDLKNCIEAKKDWMDKEERTLKLLGVYIQYIVNKYEE